MKIKQFLCITLLCAAPFVQARKFDVVNSTDREIAVYAPNTGNLLAADKATRKKYGAGWRLNANAKKFRNQTYSNSIKTEIGSKAKVTIEYPTLGLFIVSEQPVILKQKGRRELIQGEARRKSRTISPGAAWKVEINISPKGKNDFIFKRRYTTGKWKTGTWKNIATTTYIKLPEEREWKELNSAQYTIEANKED